MTTDERPATDGQQCDTEGITYHRQFDPNTDSVSLELLDAVATINGASPAELTVLAHFVDPDALDSLFQSRLDGTPRDAEMEIAFRYENYTVSIDADGTITLAQAAHPGPE